MSNEPADTELSDVTALVEAARLVYGAVLVGNDVRMVECVDHDRFESEEDVEMGLATACASSNADLVPFVMENEAEFEGIDAVSATDPTRITTFVGAIELLGDARAYYLVLDSGDGTWNRVRNVVVDEFDDWEPDAGRFVVSKTLVDDARERLGDLPESVDGEEIGVIDWSD